MREIASIQSGKTIVKTSRAVLAEAKVAVTQKRVPTFLMIVLGIDRSVRRPASTSAGAAGPGERAGQLQQHADGDAEPIGVPVVDDIRVPRDAVQQYRQFVVGGHCGEREAQFDGQARLHLVALLLQDRQPAAVRWDPGDFPRISPSLS
jgi:hypothetical protein